jgi:hypothetical protein
MYSETGLVATRDDVSKAIDACDVFLIGFRNTTMRLIVDTRHADKDGPMVETTESTGSIEGRMFWLGQRRPNFGLPEAFKFFVWPNSIDWLVASGTWERIRSRVAGIGFDAEIDAQMDKALEELKAIEHETNVHAITGKGHLTIWPAAEEDPETA